MELMLPQFIIITGSSKGTEDFRPFLMTLTTIALINVDP